MDILIDSPGAGTGYGQLNVTGTVSLQGANLNLSGNLTSYGGSPMIIINNDVTDSVIGAFSQGTAEENGVTYAVNYSGGTDNDVVLSPLVPIVTGGSTLESEWLDDSGVQPLATFNDPAGEAASSTYMRRSITEMDKDHGQVLSLTTLLPNSSP